jgi:hypothetical protein
LLPFHNFAGNIYKYISRNSHRFPTASKKSIQKHSVTVPPAIMAFAGQTPTIIVLKEGSSSPFTLPLPCALLLSYPAPALD